MEPNDRPHFLKTMLELCASFKTEPTDLMIETYFKYLSDRSLYQISKAITEIIQTGDRFPNVSTIRTLAGSFREFKTREATDATQIEEFSGASYKPENADQFFEKVGSFFNSF